MRRRLGQPHGPGHDRPADLLAEVGLDLVHDRTRLNEWTWGYNGVPFLYSDNTTVSLNPNQNVTFVGVRYIYRWQ